MEQQLLVLVVVLEEEFLVLRTQVLQFVEELEFEEPPLVEEVEAEHVQK